MEVNEQILIIASLIISGFGIGYGVHLLKEVKKEVKKWK